MPLRDDKRETESRIGDGFDIVHAFGGKKKGGSNFLGGFGFLGEYSEDLGTVWRPDEKGFGKVFGGVVGYLSVLRTKKTAGKRMNIKAIGSVHWRFGKDVGDFGTVWVKSGVVYLVESKRSGGVDDGEETSVRIGYELWF